MRLLIELRPLKTFAYETKYYHKLQGFIYSLLKETDYSILHDLKPYKFFCFSNIFPVDETIDTGHKKLLIISSPDKFFIKILEDKLNEIANIHIGEMEFGLSDTKSFKVKLGDSIKLISATPIIIRIPKRNYDKYDIPKKFRKKRYVYWRKEYNFEAFVKQLEENLIKKYNEFHCSNTEIERIFEIYKFKKGPIINHVVINGKEQIFVGSTWEFSFSYLSKEQKKILEFGIDCGFGERNSYGFGFINIIK